MVATMTPVLILCDRAPYVVTAFCYGRLWRCSWCGARVKVIA